MLAVFESVASTHGEIVREHAAWRNGTLSDADGAIHVIGTIHVEAMEM